MYPCSYSTWTNKPWQKQHSRSYLLRCSNWNNSIFFIGFKWCRSVLICTESHFFIINSSFFIYARQKYYKTWWTYKCSLYRYINMGRATNFYPLQLHWQTKSSWWHYNHNKYTYVSSKQKKTLNNVLDLSVFTSLQKN